MSETCLSGADFKSSQEVRWCPGCGDYAVLNSLQSVMADLGIPRENFAVVSGIGCSSRFPYYMNTYGFHSIHGRAPAVATGVKVANPDLSVWVVTGDGDGLAIGGNHMIHTLRRNLDVKILLFNNQIYGLTKGQYSPTSPVGTKAKSTPYGSIDRPFNPISLALGSRATFVARTMDTQPKHMKAVLRAAAEHKGSAFVEIWQNCVIFNDGAWREWTDKKVRDESVVNLVPGERMVFGAQESRGIALDCGDPKVVLADKASVWDPSTPTPGVATVLAEVDLMPDLPRAVGIFRKVDMPLYDRGLHEQIRLAQQDKGEGSMEELLYTPDTWEVD